MQELFLNQIFYYFHKYTYYPWAVRWGRLVGGKFPMPDCPSNTDMTLAILPMHTIFFCTWKLWVPVIYCEMLSFLFLQSWEVIAILLWNLVLFVFAIVRSHCDFIVKRCPFCFCIMRSHCDFIVKRFCNRNKSLLFYMILMSFHCCWQFSSKVLCY